MNDLISIIIPAYNAEQFLETTLKSVLSQTYQNIEIILVNDGSEDQTGEIADAWAIKDKRIIVLHQENQGVSAARNKGLEIAKGNLIGFVDADDEIEEDMYEFLYHNLQKYNADISHCGFELVKKDKTVQFHNTGIILIQDKFEAIKELLSGKRVEPGIWNKLFKKSVLANILFAIDIKINEDLLFNIESFKNANKIVFEDVVKYKYKYNPESASRSSKVLERSKDIFEVAKRIKKNLPETEIESEVNQFYTSKLLTNLKSLKSAKLFTTSLAKSHRQELRKSNTKNMGLRIKTLKTLLLNFPFLYDGFIYFYNIFFFKNQKWR